MIDDKVGSLVDFLAPLNNALTSFNRLYSLDFSWPSLSTLDLIFEQISDGNDPEADDLLNALAAYIGIIAHECWSTFDERLRCELTIIDDNVYLKARGGEFLGARAEAVLNISALLKVLLSNAPDPLPIFADYSLQDRRFARRFSATALGIFCGRSPWISGPWAELGTDAMASYVGQAERFLAQTTSRFYSECYPYDSLGVSPFLYHSKLILPPLGLGEQFPAASGVAGFFAFAQHQTKDEKAVDALALNLSASPDALMSIVGMISAIASDSARNRRLMAATERHQEVLPALRPALMIARKLRGKPDDWVRLVGQGETEEATALANIEISFGFVPLAFFDLSLLKRQDLIPLFQAVAWNEPATALQVLRELPTQHQSVELDLLAAFLEHAVGDKERFERSIAKLERNDASDPAMQSRVLELRAKSDVQEQRWDDAAQRFGRAYSLPCDDRDRLLMLGNNFAWSLLQAGRNQSALSVLEDLVPKHNTSLTARLNLVRALAEAGRTDDALRELREAVLFAPLDPRVFDAILAHAVNLP